MSTSIIIRVEGVESYELYNSFDKYPDGFFKWLQDFNRDFAKNYKNIPEYKIQEILLSSISSKYAGWGVLPYSKEYRAEITYNFKKDGSVTFHIA